LGIERHKEEGREYWSCLFCYSSILNLRMFILFSPYRLQARALKLLSP
jgi:hypothetical protein